jgi:bidirectional [NiFe] hydrogenase diaphorase subunit
MGIPPGNSFNLKQRCKRRGKNIGAFAFASQSKDKENSMTSSTAMAESSKTQTTAPKAGVAGDNRYKILESTMKRHQYQPDALIEVLHTAQELYGFLEINMLIHIAKSLKLPLSKVYGVATFYHFFSLAPKGAHTCVICMGTACYVKGAANILSEAERLAGIKAGMTTENGALSLMTARCIGACGIAPAVVLDGKVVGGQTEESIGEYVKGLISNGSE